MRKQLLAIGLVLLQGLLAIQSFGQCGPVHRIEEDFSTNTGQDPPECWEVYPSNNIFDFSAGYATMYGTDRVLVLPNTSNTKGTLSFNARHLDSRTYGGLNVLVGVYNGSTFTQIGTASYGTPGWKSFSFDFSANVAAGNIAIKTSSNSAITRLAIDNLVYQAECIASDSAIAIAQDITVSLDASGIVIVNPADVDNGSIKSCLAPITNLALDNSVFTCDNLGANRVALIADDDNGHTDVDSATITIIPTIELQAQITTSWGESLDSNGVFVLTDELVIDANNSTTCGGVTFGYSLDTITCETAASTMPLEIYINHAAGTDTILKNIEVTDRVAPVSMVQDVDVTINPVTGYAVVTSNMIDAGSYDACGIESIVLDDTLYSCDMLGENRVRVIVYDSAGNAAIDSVSITVESFISNTDLSIADESFCFDGINEVNTTVTVLSSESGVQYYLQDDAGMSLDTLEGNDGPLDFAVTAQENSSYGVYAEIPDGSMALNLPGSGDYLKVITPGSFDYSTAYTFSAWVKAEWVNAASSFEPIFYAGGATGSDVEVYVTNTSSALSVVHNRGNGGTLAYTTGGTLPTDGEYFHLAVSFDGSNVVIYVNGLAAHWAAIGAPVKSSGSELAFGHIVNASFPGTLSFNGLLDDIRVYDNYRHESWVSQEYDKCLEGTEDNLVLYYPLDEPANPLVYDAVSNTPGQIIAGGGLAAALDFDNALTCGVTCHREIDTLVSVGDFDSPIALGTDTTIVVNQALKSATDPNAVVLVAEDLDNGSTDNCSSVGLTYNLSQSSFTIADTGVQVVTFYVEDYSGNIDSTTISVTVLEYNPVGVQELMMDGELSLYPNPNDGLVNLELKTGEIASVKVWNMRGELVKVLEGQNSGELQFEMNNEPGAYLLEVQSENRVGRFKMILE